jgi:hypothetical protein
MSEPAAEVMRSQAIERELEKGRAIPAVYPAARMPLHCRERLHALAIGGRGDGWGGEEATNSSGAARPEAEGVSMSRLPA